MSYKVLKAVTRMLDEALVKATQQEAVKEAFAIVKCAKIMLDELTKEDKAFLLNSVDPLVKHKPMSAEPQPELVVEGGLLKEIKNFSLDAELMFNGKKIKHKDALGKPFQSAEML